MAGLGLQQNLSLGQTLSPQMQQSLQFLQAAALELQSLVQQEIEINPVLEEATEEPRQEEAPTGDEGGSEGESDEGGLGEGEGNGDEDWQKELDVLKRNEEEWRDYFSQSHASGGGYSQEAAERRQFLFDSQVEAPRLSEHLLRQLTMATQQSDLRLVGQEIIGDLDDDGFLQVPLAEIAAATPVDYAVALKALELIQSFDPVGVAARDLKECLLIQLRRLGKGDDVEGLVVTHHLPELGRKKFQEMARKLKVPLERVQQAAQLIATLQPRPGSQFSTEDKQNIVQPELAVRKEEEQWIVVMNDDPVPRLRISDTYKDLLATDGKDPSLREYLKEKIRAGKFLIKCLHQRQQTIQSIATEIVKRQQSFFEHGVSHLRPLTMNQVAEVVGVHETTVSRAIANKFVQTPWGVFDLKFFFTPGYQTSSGEVLSNASVKDSIQELVQRENPKRPLSDQEIVGILDERGIPLARRTVAKYRTELGILPSNLRKQL
jgi:RNA polymerase sigma-54 factor